ncbi:unnamed protein product [Ambrosiozyma monospora]|uniref:Unnamed protein product n=1 Tax=Ambrosiozyma monospora TaxID=43982 RepID=A0ACB5SV98_AMBMO|nr:unnamed protein product [Ambrosiozyma monospora]
MAQYPTDYFLDHVNTLMIDSDALVELWKDESIKERSVNNKPSQPRDTEPQLVLNIIESRVEDVLPHMMDRCLSELTTAVAENKKDWQATVWIEDIKLTPEFSNLFNETGFVKRLKLGLEDIVSMGVVQEISEIEDFNLSRSLFTLSGSTFQFKSMSSLRKLSLGVCPLTESFFDLLPDTLQIL